MGAIRRSHAQVVAGCGIRRIGVHRRGALGRPGRSRRQARLHRSAVGRRCERRHQRPEAFHLPRRQDQRGGRTQRREAADRLLRQQGRSAGVADCAQEGARRGRALRLPGQRQRGGARHLGRRAEVQRAQSRQGGALLQLRGGGPCADQRQMQLLALPVRLRCGHEDGGAREPDRLPAPDQEDLSHQPGLFVRQGGRGRRTQDARRKARARSAPRARSAATASARSSR